MTADVISPELALVCPELRKRGIEVLPELDPDALFRPRRRLQPPQTDLLLPSVPELPADDLPADDLPPRLVAAVVYTASCAARSAASGALVVGVVAAVAAAAG